MVDGSSSIGESIQGETSRPARSRSSADRPVSETKPTSPAQPTAPEPDSLSRASETWARRVFDPRPAPDVPAGSTATALASRASVASARLRSRSIPTFQSAALCSAIGRGVASRASISRRSAEPSTAAARVSRPTRAATAFGANGASAPRRVSDRSARPSSGRPESLAGGVASRSARLRAESAAANHERPRPSRSSKGVATGKVPSAWSRSRRASSTADAPVAAESVATSASLSRRSVSTGLA